MSLLRRLLGGGSTAPSGAPGPAASGGSTDQDEVERERELLREDARRLAGDLLARQLRYADRSWTPPTQGGEVRASLESTSTPDER